MLSKEERECYEEQIRLIKEAAQELKKDNDAAEETFVCNNCLEEYTEDEMGTSELAMQDGICMYCEQDGYGR